MKSSRQLLDLGRLERAGMELRACRTGATGVSPISSGGARKPAWCSCSALTAPLARIASASRVEPRQVIVRPDAELAGKTLAAPLHMRRAGHHQPEAAVRPHRQPAELLVRKACRPA